MTSNDLTVSGAHYRINSVCRAIDAVNARLDDEFSPRMNDHGRALAELKGQFARLQDYVLKSQAEARKGFTRDDRRSGSDRRGQ